MKQQFENKLQYSNLDNSIENVYREMEKDDYSYGKEISEYEFYSYFSDDRLKEILPKLHYRFINLFNMMNQRLPTKEDEAHFWAEPSRSLIQTIEWTKELQAGLKKSQYSFEIDEYYQSLIDECDKFLKKFGGSTLPPNMKKIVLYYTIPIFKPNDVLERKEASLSVFYPFNLKGGGSYAFVYKYEDVFYQKTFACKRLKSDSNEKEIKRFKQEFEEMAKLKSPYIIEVYRYDDEKKEYYMEYMDYSLEEYFKDRNGKMEESERKNIGLQILKAFKYIHSKKILHRDISLKNVLIKKYEDSIVVKISDFGLVKIPNSDLTSDSTDVRGCFNDPSLRTEGFSNYNLQHEIYALTYLLCFVRTGKTNLDKIKDSKIKKFLEIGMNSDKTKRFKNLEELKKAFDGLF